MLLAFAVLAMLTMFAVLATGCASPKHLKTIDDYSVSDVIIKDVRAIDHFLYGEITTSVKKMKEPVTTMIGDLFEETEAKGIHFHPPLTFVYQGMTGDMDKDFQLQIGFPVHDDSKAFGKWKTGGLPAQKMAVVYYSGAMKNVGEAYGKLMPTIFKAGMRPAGPIRELYHHWEGEDSPNNLTEIQVAVE